MAPGLSVTVAYIWLSVQCSPIHIDFERWLVCETLGMYLMSRAHSLPCSAEFTKTVFFTEIDLL